jgi:hypothetical protein
MSSSLDRREGEGERVGGEELYLEEILNSQEILAAVLTTANNAAG